MGLHLSAVTLVVPDYDEAVEFYVGKPGFDLIEDTKLSDAKRWVLVAPPGSKETRLLLAKADSAEQKMRIGNQAGGRVFLFLHTDDFQRDYAALRDKGVRFLEQPRHESYDTVAVFVDPYGNKWDLIQPVR
jgi:catechol 2,3-dioxygenase-like lactoylglutathione lyase family enzyme